ncbi:MAG: radical SAM family heme chaperone HemW [Treponema sp.]|nr:radical SAM family heme chaperone HemW [Treponema sp.]
MSLDASLYIHIPFCSSKCDYCDFYSITEKNDRYIDSFLKALILDIKNQIKYFDIKNILTVYIGGGTPSVLGKKISFIFDELKTINNFSPEEFTVEANPESVNEEFLETCFKGGVTRISLGIQTFHEPSRTAVNRGNVKMRFYSHFQDSLSIDLITGLPFQDIKTIKNDIKKVLEYNPSHISLYSLSLEKGTPLEEKQKKGTVLLPEGDLADSLWLLARDILKNEGFEHYEISNFAKPGKQCIHNNRYWQIQNWIGAGPSASGTIVNNDNCTARRFTHLPDVNGYIKSPYLTADNCEELDSNTFLRECLFMGFRCKDGPDPNMFKKRFNISVEDCIPRTLENWKGKDKMLFLNSFMTDVFSELDRTNLTLHQSF